MPGSPFTLAVCVEMVLREVGLEAFASDDDDQALERFRAAFTLD